jgi:hypothetical protein
MAVAVAAAYFFLRGPAAPAAIDDWTNLGTVNWTNTTIYGRAGAKAQIYNYGKWKAQSDDPFVGGDDSATTLSGNFGTFLKSGNTGTTTLVGGFVFNNKGTINGITCGERV